MRRILAALLHTSSVEVTIKASQRGVSDRVHPEPESTMSPKSLVFGAVVVVLVAGFVEGFHLGGFAKGGGKSYGEEEHSAKGEKGDEAYSSFHEVDRGAKGHHDKEGHKGHYAEVGGNKNAYFDKGGYHKEQNKAVKGSAGFDYADHATWAKGHHTKGKHNIHKLDELKKKTEFFDEDHDQAYKEKHGGYETKFGFAAGAKKKAGGFNKGFLQGAFGLGGGFEKSKHSSSDKGHDNEEGKNEYYSKGEKFNKDGGSGLFKKWGWGFS